MEVIRGQRVAFEYELRNNGGALVTAGASVTISPTQTTGAAWLAGTPTLITNQFENGKYRVEFYVPTAQGAAPINELLYPITVAAFGSEAPAQVTSAIKVVPPPAGLTVLIHGFQPPLISSCADEGNSPPLDFMEIGSAILTRAGKGRLRAFNYQSDTFTLLTTPTPRAGTSGYAGEDLVVVNWCDISNNPSLGHGESVAQSRAISHLGIQIESRNSLQFTQRNHQLTTVPRENVGTLLR